ncbi:MaoC family dehydratase N-terminal domain-containing protein [Tropheryma whipplei]|uniref:UPF0336 protein TWT_721 n=2 Tax=Tropheryma whipplei TaxID=2039 RepID=Y721_TROWT|nr:MaoC family dehydratase N-terminal domain-containing protein [Tropheryma whipplei]Q83FK2.1 RecName: Full=UPF0336 protein TWT_721 [Tropheryma whipplei str. Twist]Q83HA5.1 RecName: Full=UPF0336 protein TW736 [Tropheryma whipplei TW08/27]AAO44818.1 unknown [Tropheryma whipplei str. Twist]MCO8182466.1 MaoC family dehydratase N-terminal domain-containing protein [Tropheryma whipplei]MCO8190310.1 MaoC family dehydratase N-terminal domain-containing protein [Tropheryma whipplei]CAD67395.1 conserv
MTQKVEFPPRHVTEEKLMEFARAVHTQNKIYHSTAAATSSGYPGLVAVPTFGAVWVGQILEYIISSDLNIDYSHIVHGEQHFLYKRPIFAGDILRPILRIKRDRAFGNARQIVLEVTLLSEGSNDDVLVMTITLIVRGKA